MAKYRFNTLTWDVARHHGHSAFRLLRIVYEIDQESSRIRDRMREVPREDAEYLKLLILVEHQTTDMFRLSAASIMMFQAMMEALINDSLEREAKLGSVSKNASFRDKWCGALETLAKDTASFERYNADVYTKFRNPLVHPKRVEMDSFDDLSFAALHAGYRAGWAAYESLYDGLGHPLDADSWGTICKVHQIPSDVQQAS